MTAGTSYCNRCGERVVGGAAFCHACGSALLAPNEAPPRRLFQFTITNNLAAITLLVATAFAVAYHVSSGSGLSQTYAVFVGLPLLIGVMTAYMTRPQEGLGMTVKVTTILLCVLCPLLGQGAICILMAAPLFYGIAVAGYLVVAGTARLITGRRGPFTVLLLPLLPFLGGALSHGPGGIAHPRTLTVTSQIRIAAPPESVWAALQSQEIVGTEFPLFLRLGFPLPTGIQRQPDGLTRLTFGSGAGHWNGSNVIVSVQLASPDSRSLRFLIREDGTMLSYWLRFKETRFELTPDQGGTVLKQTTRFTQTLQPGVYFNPLESYAVGQMHNYALGRLRQLAEHRG